jgi:hypothetical protein
MGQISYSVLSPSGLPNLVKCLQERPGVFLRGERGGYALGVTNNHLTKLEMPSRDKYSSLLGLFVNYCSKSFITSAPGRNRRNMRVNKFLSFMEKKCFYEGNVERRGVTLKTMWPLGPDL